MSFYSKPVAGSWSGAAWARRAVVVAGFALLWPTAASGQFCVSLVPGIEFGVDGGSDIPSTDRCLGAFYCKKPELSAPTLTAVFVPDPVDPHKGTYTIRASYPFVAEGNHLNDGTGGTTTDFRINFHWFDEPAPPPATCFPPPIGTCEPIGSCGFLGASVPFDQGEVYAEVGGVTCQNLAQRVSALSLTALRCATPAATCTTRTDSDPITLPDLRALLECPEEPNCCDLRCEDCKDGLNVGASAGAYCPLDRSTGRGARLAWAGGGPGSDNVPGAAVWRPALGRGWSHDYAMRIVEAPDDSHVWLITKTGNYREFWSPVGGVYQGSAPPDEYRTLSRTAGGWQLRDLVGTVQSFGADGRWQGAVDASGNATTPTYDGGGRLATVSFADGRGETFSYHPDGKLAAITEVGVDGVPARSWSYAWSGDDLARVDRPDGTAEEYVYGDARFPGYLTRIDEVGTDASRRVKKGWEYDAEGNVVRTWRGDTVAGPTGDAPGPAAVAVWGVSFDDPVRPTSSLVTDPLGQVATYSVESDEQTGQTRVTSISGDCPTCGLGPNTRLFYDDPANPMLPTRTVDGRGTTTLMTYDGNGRMTSRTEALGTPEARTTNWTYGDPAFPGVATRTERPSTSAGSLRATELTLDGSGNALQRIESGVEAGSAFSLTTTTTYSAAGRPLSIDPPGYAAADLTSFSYDPARGGLLALTRTDPIVGTTSFGYDSLNRQTTTTDPNGLVSELVYDEMDRVTEVIERGATAAEDLVIDHEFNVFGDLSRTVFAEGNVVEYGYDAAGRLLSVARGPAAGNMLERTAYELDDAGNRTRERLQRWTGAAWETTADTAFVYATRCRLDRMIKAPGTPAEAATDYEYDCNGNLASVWDPNHEPGVDPPTWAYAYDALDRRIRVTQPWSGAGGGSSVTSYGYDVQDHLSSFADAEGNTTTFAHSDRDLLTLRVSPVSGTTSFEYNEHRQQVAEIDGRGVSTTMTVDAFGRLLFVDSSENALDTSFTYDDPAVAFSKGRLTAISRPGSSVEYAYDRFGRRLTDGELAYSYDRNGNVRTITYPGGVSATWSHDYADRDETLTLDDGGTTIQLVTASSYLPAGPLATLTLGNGVSESRGFDGRYDPTGIVVAGLVDWSYVTDAVGNILQVDDGIAPAGSRSFAYQDVDYFLTQADGPWGSLAWSYDKIGNRLAETRGGATSTYSYVASPGGGNSARLSLVTPATGDPDRFFFDAAGNRSYRSSGAAKSRFTYDALGRLSQIRTDSPDSVATRSSFGYDGRGFLAAAELAPFPGRPATVRTLPTYSSNGVLHHKRTSELLEADDPRNGISALSDSYVLYFSGRPVAVLEKQTVTEVGGATTTSTELLYLSTDHLQTPLLATDGTGTAVWNGGFEPFGRDHAGAAAAGVFLRLPGQWDDPAWSPEGADTGLLYNLHRWYDPATGLYARVDPLLSSINEFSYGDARPLSLTDPLGLVSLDPKTCAPFRDQPGDGGPGEGCCYDDLEEAVQQFNEFFTPGWKKRHPECWKAIASKSGKWTPRGDQGRLSPLSCMVGGSRGDVMQCRFDDDSAACGNTTKISGKTSFGPEICDSETCPSPLNVLFHEQLHRCGAPAEAWGLITVAADIARTCVGR